MSAAAIARARDPRHDPMPGDIIRKGPRYGETYYEVLPHDPRYFDTDISFDTDGIERVVSIEQWRMAMATAEIVRIFEESYEA